MVQPIKTEVVILLNGGFMTPQREISGDLVVMCLVINSFSYIVIYINVKCP